MGSAGADRPAYAMAEQDGLTFQLAARPAEISSARRAVHGFVRDRGVPAELADDIQLVVSELVTNAVQHGRGPSVGVDVGVRPPAEVMVSVANDGPMAAIPAVSSWTTPPGLPRHGHGLGIVRALCPDVEVRGDDAHAMVVCWWRARREGAS